MTTKHKNVTHVIFDVDGLLLNTEDQYTDIMREICRPYGKEFTWALKVKMMGKKQREAAKIFIDELAVPLTVDEYVQKVDKIEEKVFPNCEILPGVEALVHHLNTHNIPMALATGAKKKEFAWKVSSHLEFFSLFSHTVFGCDPEVKDGKPSPDIFLVATKRFEDSPDPENVLVFEDAPNGVVGSLAGGFQVVWVPHPHLDKATMIDRATLTLDSLTEFIPEEFGLPAFDNV